MLPRRWSFLQTPASLSLRKSAAICSALSWLALNAVGDYAPIYASPTTDSVTGGELGINLVDYGSSASNGVGVWTPYLILGGAGKGPRAVRWDQSGETGVRLGDLGVAEDGWGYSQAFGIDETGTAVGGASKHLGGIDLGIRAVRWYPSTTQATELGHLGTDYRGYTISRAQAVNASGVAVGYADKYVSGARRGERAVRWMPGDSTAIELDDIGTQAGGYTQCFANAISDTGIAVGYGTKFDEIGYYTLGYRAVRWDASGSATMLGEISISSGGYGYSNAAAVNNSGIAVGYSWKYDESNAEKGDRAVRWNESGIATELGVLGTDNEGDSNSRALDVNDAGVAIGYSNAYENGVFKGTRPVRWDPATAQATELGNLGTSATGSRSGRAYSINNLGIAVGSMNQYGNEGQSMGGRAVMWLPDGEPVILDSLLDPEDAAWWDLRRASFISDDNWISGYAYHDPDGNGPLPFDTCGFLMHVSVPEPSFASTAFIVMLLCRVSRRERRAI